MNNFFETVDHTSEYDYNDIESINPMVMALTYILPFVPFITNPNSSYAKFHANQGLLCWGVGIVLSIVSKILCVLFSFIPLINMFLPKVISSIIGLVIVLFFIVGIMNALNKQAKELPFIGNISIIK